MAGTADFGARRCFDMEGDILVAPDNYPSKGSGERGAFFRDSEGNLLGIGQATR